MTVGELRALLEGVDDRAPVFAVMPEDDAIYGATAMVVTSEDLAYATGLDVVAVVPLAVVISITD